MRKTFVFKFPSEVKFNDTNELRCFFRSSYMWFKNDNNNGILIEFWEIFGKNNNYVYDKEDNRISFVIDEKDSLISYENAKNICFVFSLHYNFFQYSGSIDAKNDKNYYFLEFDVNNKEPGVQGFENEEEFNKWNNTNSDTIAIVESEKIVSSVLDQKKDEIKNESEEKFNEIYDHIIIRFKKPTEKQNNNPENYRCGIYVTKDLYLDNGFNDKNYVNVILTKEDAESVNKFKFYIEENGNNKFGNKSDFISFKELIKKIDVYKYKDKYKNIYSHDIIVTLESGEICIQSAGKVREQLQKKLQTKDELQKKLQIKIRMIKKIITTLVVLSIILVAASLLTLGLFTGGVVPAILTPLIAKCLIGVLGGIGVLGFLASLLVYFKGKTLEKSINLAQGDIDTLQNEINDLGEEDNKLDDKEKGNNEPEMLKDENGNEYRNE